MNTTAAALQANVTTATIRTWCRRGVIAATKTAGRWIIDTASLAHRIAIAAMRRTRKETPVALDLNATYTYTSIGDTQPRTIAPRIKTRERDGKTITSITRIAPLLADKIDAIEDGGDRLHTLTVLERSGEIYISDQPRDLAHAATRDEGRIATSYSGTRHLPVSVVLDLAEKIRATLA